MIARLSTTHYSPVYSPFSTRLSTFYSTLYSTLFLTLCLLVASVSVLDSLSISTCLSIRLSAHLSSRLSAIPWRVFLGCPACICISPIPRLHLTVSLVSRVSLYLFRSIYLVILQQIHCILPLYSIPLYHCIQLPAVYPYVSNCNCI